MEAKSRGVDLNEGSSYNVSLQLACYAMYAMEKWVIEPERIRLMEYNLLADQGVEFSVGPVEIENASSYISGSIADMQSLLIDVCENVPKEEGAFQKIEEERDRA